jgi:hypothetical protein
MTASRLSFAALLFVSSCGDNLSPPPNSSDDPTALTCSEYAQLEPTDLGVECLIAGHVDWLPGVSYRSSTGDTWAQRVYEFDGQLGTWGRRDISQATSCEWFPCLAVCDYADGGCP